MAADNSKPDTCTKCRHYMQVKGYPSWMSDELASKTDATVQHHLCMRYASQSINPVSGVIMTKGARNAFTERRGPGLLERLFGTIKCGSKGAFFETNEGKNIRVVSIADVPDID